MNKNEITFGIIKIPLDFIMTILAFFAAYELRLITEDRGWYVKPVDYTALPTFSEYLNFSIYSALALVIVFALGRLYSIRTTLKFSKESQKVFTLCVVWVMLIISFFFFTRQFPFSRLAIIYSWALTFFLIILARGLMRIIQVAFLRAGVGKRRLLIFGNNSVSKELTESLKLNPSYKVVGNIDNFSQLEYTLKKKHVDEIIQTKESNTEEVLELCDQYHVEYSFTPDLTEVRKSHVEFDTISTIPVIKLKKTPLDGWGKVTKRLMDFLGSFFGIIILSPILLITAIAIKLESKGPIIFSRLDDGTPVKRVGHKGRHFKFYKFRSMHPNTDSHRYSELAHKNTRQDGPLVKIKDDPRVTRVGKFIRKYSIDELPQLYNVLMGHVSLVGPRPHLPEEVAKYERHHKFVLTIKPGLTGLPQTSGRSDLTFDEEVKLDRYYIENWSLWLDIKLIFKTIGVILRGHDE